jgi:beta-glucosidase
MPRELREVFMMPFEAAVKEAKLASVMNAYHELDGIPCGASKTLLTEILRDEWGFDGVVVSDFFTVPMLTGYHHVAQDRSEAAAMALEAGLDVELPQIVCYGQPLREAVAKGVVSMEVIDQAVARILTMKFRIGLFETPYVDIERVDAVFDTLEQRSLARTLARKSIVLLKNSDNLLPLKKDTSSIAVIGPNAHNTRHMLGDYSHPSSLEELGGDLDASQRNGLGPDLIGVSMNTLLGAVKEKVASGTSVHYAKGCEVLSDSQEGFAEAVEAAKKSDVAIVVVGERSGTTLSATSGEFRDRADIGLPGVQKELVQAVCETGTPVVVVLIGGRPLSIPWITWNVSAVVEAWLPGEAGGEAVSEVLFGDYNPGGKLPITIPRATGQIPIYYNHKPSGARSFYFADYVDLSCTPLFAFGHGLSYTRFEYSDLRIQPESVDVGGEAEISVDVKNIGEREGEDVIQLYVHDAQSNITRPVMELKGFKRLSLSPGENRTVKFTLFVDQLGFYDAEMRYVVEPGAIEVMIGSASDDIRLEGKFEITGKVTDISSSKVFFSTSEVM